MKILFVTEDIPAPHLGGAGKHAVLLANALIEVGHEVEMLGCISSTAIEVNNSFLGKLHTEIDFSHIGLKEVALGIFNPVRRILMAWRIWKAIKKVSVERFDVIHYHGHIVELGVLVPKHINYVHTLHDQGSECMTMMRFKNGAPCKSVSPVDCAGCATKSQPNILQKMISSTAVVFHRYLARKAFTRHKAIFVSDFVLRRFKEVVGDSDDFNATVIHNFTDARSMQGLPKLAFIQKPMNTRPALLLAGRVHVTKGQALFLESIPDDLLSKIDVRIAGDGPDLAQLKEMHEKRGVTFLGWLSQNDIYKETMQADACVVPSIWEEPCGTVSLEALALGKVVFCLARGGTPEQMRYCNYPNQLRLFVDMSSMVRAIELMDYVNTYQNVSLNADVSGRLPEILNVYSKALTTP
jgi:glycosyltransferase involved in cell wall biosynthesis